MTRRARLLPVLAVFLPALAAAGCVISVDGDQVVVRDEHRFASAGVSEVTLETFDGSVRVESWDRPEVLIVALRRGPDREAAEALEVQVAQDGQVVRGLAPSPRVRREFVGIGAFSAPSVSFEASIPRNMAVSVETRDGSVTVSRVTGAVRLRTGDGSIRADGIDGDLTARTGDGSVRVAEVSGRIDLETGDGSVHVQGRLELLRARTRDGSVVVEADRGSRMAGDWDISTGDGTVVFRVPDAFDGDIDAASRDGRVSADIAGFEPTTRERAALRGRLGAGGHVVRLRSGDGSIRVQSR